MRQRTMWLSSFGAGAATAFFFDPLSGTRRRHRVTDSAAHLRHRATAGISTVTRDLQNRTRGLVTIAQRRFRSEHPDDAVLEERVHSVLGHIMAHPHALTVKVNDGCVVIDGPIPSRDRKSIRRAVRAIAGVQDVELCFDPHIQPAYEPGADAAHPHVRAGAGPDIVQRNWAPATRSIVAGAGAALVGAGIVRRDRVGAGLALAGAALVARAASNVPWRQLATLGWRRRTAGLRKNQARRPSMYVATASDTGERARETAWPA